MCETNASVSGCTLDDGAARLQETLALGVFDDEEGGAVFDGAAGVLEFGFAEDGAAGFFGEFFEADEGGFADCWEVLVLYVNLLVGAVWGAVV